MRKIIVTGNAGSDPILKQGTHDEFAVFSLAVSAGTKASTRTDWYDITCNDKLRDIVMQYVRKGSKLLIEGSPDVTAYLGKDGKVVGKIRVYANSVEFIGSVEKTETSSHDKVASSEVPF